MKNKRLQYHCQSAKIYRHHYRPSLNLIRFFKSIVGVLVAGASPTASQYSRLK